MQANELLATTDASVWAREFKRTFGDNVVDEEAMFGWFANAIEIGRSAGATEQSEGSLHVEIDDCSMHGADSSKPGFYTLTMQTDPGEIVKLRLSKGAAAAARDVLDWLLEGKGQCESTDLAETEQASGEIPQSVRDLIEVGLTFGHAGSNRGDCKERYGIDDCVICLTEKAAADLGLPTEPKRECDSCGKPVPTLEGHSLYVNGVEFWLHAECEKFASRVIAAANPPEAALDA